MTDTRREIIAYDYRDELGHLRYQNVRYLPKDFRHRRPDSNGGYIYNLDGVEHILYRLPELCKADRAQWVFYDEGEKDVDNVRVLGLTATTAGSANSWRQEFKELFYRRRVCIIPDADEPGRKLAQRVAADIYGEATEVKILNLPAEICGQRIKDVSDWIEAQDTKPSEDLAAALMGMANAAPDWTPTDLPTLQAEPESYPLPAYIDVADFLAKPLPLAEPIIHGLLRRGETGTLVSSSKARKSWTAQELCEAVATGGTWFGLSCRQGRALLLDCELQLPTLQHRIQAILQAKGTTPEAIRGRLALASWRGQIITLERLASYLAAIRPGEFDLIVADPIYKLYPKGFQENDNGAMAELFGNFQTLAERANAALMLVCHSPKGDTSARTTIDLVSGAGSAGRAVDVAVALRAHESAEPGAPVIVRETIARSFADLPPECFRWEHPRWVAAPNLDPRKLQSSSGRRKKANEQALPTEPPKPSYDVAGFVAAFLTMDAKPRAAIITDAVAAGLSERRAKMLLESAEGQGKAHRWKVGKTNLANFANRPQPKLIDETEAAK